MKIISWAAAAAIAITASSAQAATKVDLSTYSVSLTKSLVVPDNGGGAEFGEASGVAYNWDRDSLIIVGDEGTVQEWTKAGDFFPGVRRYLGASAFQDPEGVTYIGDGDFALADERTMQMWLMEPAITRVTPGLGDQWNFGDKNSGKFYAFSPEPVGNIGLEGIAYDPLTGGFFGVKQEGPQAVYFADVDIRNPAGGSHVEFFDPVGLGLTTLSDIAVLSTVTAFDGEQFQENLLILSAASERLVEVDRQGNLLSSFDLSNITSDTGGRISAIEGVVLDRDGNIYLVAELGGSQGSSLIVLTRSAAAVPEPATWAMMLAGFGAVGAAARAGRRRLAVRYATS